MHCLSLILHNRFTLDNFDGKRKGKIFPVRALKANMESRDVAPLIPKLGTVEAGGEWST
jgi:hypothetical protein